MASPKETAMDAEDDSSVLTALCCAADITAEAKRHFLQTNEEDFGEPYQSFVFVDSLAFKHTAPDLPTSNFTASSHDSPFKGKTTTECSALLTRLASNTGAYILGTVFAIFDDRTLRDGSILLVQTVDDELEEMRILPELACGKLLQYMVCDADITEDREEAEEEEDCVYRIHDHFLDDDARPMMTSCRGSRWGG